ncbi:MAG: ADP compounds hydrolase NudE [Pseudomonadota bacterium]
MTDVPPDPYALPVVEAARDVAASRLFRIEQLELRFDNGVRRTYERLPARGRQAVIVVAIDDTGQVQLVQEYAAGLHRYQLTLPKGTAEANETLEAAAVRELREEVGLGARTLTYLRRLNIAPSHMGFTIHVVLAQGLYPAPLEGDEPEPLVVVPWPLQEIDALFLHEQFDEARAIAALQLARLRLAQGAPFANTETPARALANA